MTRNHTLAMLSILSFVLFAAGVAPAAVMQITPAEFEDPKTLDFESASEGAVGPMATVFTDFGITSATAVRDADSGDVISTGDTGKAIPFCCRPEGIPG